MPRFSRFALTEYLERSSRSARSTSGIVPSRRFSCSVQIFPPPTPRAGIPNQFLCPRTEPRVRPRILANLPSDIVPRRASSGLVHRLILGTAGGRPRSLRRTATATTVRPIKAAMSASGLVPTSFSCSGSHKSLLGRAMPICVRRLATASTVRPSCWAMTASGFAPSRRSSLAFHDRRGIVAGMPSFRRRWAAVVIDRPVSAAISTSDFFPKSWISSCVHGRVLILSPNNLRRRFSTEIMERPSFAAKSRVEALGPARISQRSFPSGPFAKERTEDAERPPP